MPNDIDALSLLLFVPADRPERYANAFASGADATVLDLEDAVAPDRKLLARDILVRSERLIEEASCPVIVRVNAWGSAHHKADLAALMGLGHAATMLAKAESADAVALVSAATGRPVIALIESARGLQAARSIAAASARLAFGSIDFAADLGCAHTRESLLLARSELVLASRLAGRPAPIDGVTTSMRDDHQVTNDVAYAVGLGFGGKLLIHPAQVDAGRRGLLPRAEDIAWADRVLAGGAGGATSVDGAMVDAPVRVRAEQIRRRAKEARQVEAADWLLKSCQP